MSGQHGYYAGAYGAPPNQYRGYQDQQPRQSYDPRQYSQQPAQRYDPQQYPQQPRQGYGSPQYSQPHNQQYHGQPSGSGGDQIDLVTWQGSAPGDWQSNDDANHHYRQAETDWSRTQEFVDETQKGLGGSKKKPSSKSHTAKGDRRRKATDNIAQFDNNFYTPNTRSTQ
ncbi:hypothetical protein EDB80DRAFT_376431 [Ilyonectria destructans]|nr:hypothetical protein EDB80DRAFT_376431 [Ilyonectria destructans]